jgi:hypothetical protein
MVKKATRFNQQGVYSSKRQMSKLKGRKIDSQDHSAEEPQRQTLKNATVEGFWAKRRLALCCQGQ